MIPGFFYINTYNSCIVFLLENNIRVDMKLITIVGIYS